MTSTAMALLFVGIVVGNCLRPATGWGETVMVMAVAFTFTAAVVSAAMGH